MAACGRSISISWLVELRQASTGSDKEYAAVLERALAACAWDPGRRRELDELDLRSTLADVYDRTGRVARL